jgi:hypothetical protein
MRQANLYAKQSKCTFYQDQVEFLGFIVNQDGVTMDPRRVADIVSWEEPGSYHDIQVFLGFCNFYRRFIQDFSRIALPLTTLLRGSKNGRKPGRVELSPSEKVAFRRLIAAFQTAPLLRHFDPQRHIRVETDASNEGMAGILSQPDDHDRYHPVAFWSKKFTGAELNYGTPDQELFAIVHSFKHWRHYLEGSRFPVEVLTDHSNLQSFMKQPKLNGRQARWCMSLAPFDFMIKHRSGKTNPADGPSRRSGTSQEDAPRAELLVPLKRRMCTETLPSGPRIAEMTFEDLISEKSQFEYGKTPSGENPRLSTRIAESSPSKGTGAETADWAVWEKLSSEKRVSQSEIQDACKTQHAYVAEANVDLKALIRRLQAEDPETQRRKAAIEQKLKGFKCWTVCPEGLVRYKTRLYIPTGENLRQRLLSLHHDDPLAGHFGRNRTETLLKRKFHWIGIQSDVTEYVETCAICQGAAAPRHRPYGTLGSLPIPSRPFTELSMDFITGLPPTIHEGKIVDSILVIVDRFTKWSIFLAVSCTINAAELAELFHTQVELKFGPPNGIVSDRGPVFTSKFWSKLCYISQIRMRLSTAFHPQTDGQTERTNQTLEHYLRCFIDENQTLWPKLLPTAQFACNNAINATTGSSPFETLLGYSPHFHLRAEDGTSSGEAPAAEVRAEKLQNLRQQLKEHWRKATETQAKHYNDRHKPFTFKRGDLVALSTQNLKLKVPSRKLAPRYIGPFRVLEAIGSQAYRLSLPNQYDQIHNVFHISLLEPWKQRSGRNGTENLPMPDLEDDGEWEVEEIKEEQCIDETPHFLIKWKGWPSEYNQWVPESDMANARGAITRFRKQKQNKAYHHDQIARS